MSKRKHDLVCSNEPIEKIDIALAMPKELFSEDGRRFGITKWAPSISVDSMVIAKIEVIVEIPIDE